MKLVVSKSRLKGSVAIPGSKSHTIRAVAIASLAAGKSQIRSPLVSNDTLSAVSTYKALGASIDTSDSHCWKVTGIAGRVTAPGQIVDVGNSGTTLRLAIGSAALAPADRTTTFTGDDQTRTRPIGPLLQSLNDLGAKCRSLNDNGRAPASVTGQIKGGRTSIAAFTSQYLSSLLMCTPLASNDTEIDVTLLNEPGYVRMTLDWLDKQKIKYENDSMRRFRISGGQSYKPFDCAVPADFSSATFFLCAAALVGDDVTLTDLDFADSQPDMAVVDYLKAMGAKISVKDNVVNIKSSPLKGIEIDMNKTPDALPALAVTAAFAEGTTRLVNVPQARAKETDRIKCMAQELATMNVAAEELPDGLIIHGAPGLKGGAKYLDGHGDHRIVMALAIAGLLADSPITIDTAEAMNVTFPDFVKLMSSLGANLKLTG